MVTERRRVAKIGLHSIYGVKKTEMIPLFKKVENVNRDEEQQYVNLFQQLEVNKGFYFSYTYDLTHSLQENIMRKIKNRTE